MFSVLFRVPKAQLLADVHWRYVVKDSLSSGNSESSKMKQTLLRDISERSYVVVHCRNAGLLRFDDGIPVLRSIAMHGLVPNTCWERPT